MVGVLFFIVFGLVMMVGFYLGILAVKTDKNWKKYTDPVIDAVERMNFKAERKTQIKKRYGFDDSYDKYIA